VRLREAQDAAEEEERKRKMGGGNNRLVTGSMRMEAAERRWGS
jgi:hypothetical protein